MSADAPGGADAPPVRTVRCPRCGGPARYAADNPWRPFCSERCQRNDLGAWAAERFRIEGAPPEAPEDTPRNDAGA